MSQKTSTNIHKNKTETKLICKSKLKLKPNGYLEHLVADKSIAIGREGGTVPMLLENLMLTRMNHFLSLQMDHKSSNCYHQ